MPRTSRGVTEKSQWLAAIADPMRLAIIQILVTGEKTVTEIARLCDDEVVNISHHLGVMWYGGLVNRERDGRFMLYSLKVGEIHGTELEMKHESGVRVTIPLV